MMRTRTSRRSRQSNARTVKVCNGVEPKAGVDATLVSWGPGHSVLSRSDVRAFAVGMYGDGKYNVSEPDAGSCTVALSIAGTPLASNHGNHNPPFGPRPDRKVPVECPRSSNTNMS